MGPETFYDVSFDYITTMDLFNKLQFGSQLLVIDVRSKQAFAA